MSTVESKVYQLLYLLVSGDHIIKLTNQFKKFRYFMSAKTKLLSASYLVGK